MELQWIYNILFVGVLTLIGLGWNISYIRKKKKKLSQILSLKTKRLDEQQRQIQDQGKELIRQKEKTESLLRNLLPEEAIEELKTKGVVTARSYSNASVLFTDIKGFTKIAASMRPQELVQILNRYFTVFDEIIGKHNLEKIKTIGDSYMCAGGIPRRNNTHPFETILAALEIQAYMKMKKAKSVARGENYLDLRIGIHTGELVAGVIGQKRLAYDVWGDTVNIAHFLEQACEIEQVNISSATHQLVAPLMDCRFKGSFPNKNGKPVDMYYVQRIKPAFSDDKEGMVAGPIFRQHMHLLLHSNMGYLALREHILHFLEKELPADLQYHSLDHTISVENAAQEIGLAEGIRGEELFILKTAALFHDAGFVERYQNNEEIGARMAKDTLPKFGYNPEQINLIYRLILSTRVPQQPKTHLERILCDADLYYLGTTQFKTIGDSLFKELSDRGVVETEFDWNKIQRAFLGNHVYHTEYCIQKLRPKKLSNYALIPEA